jgi:hypothetical protein
MRCAAQAHSDTVARHALAAAAAGRGYFSSREVGERVFKEPQCKSGLVMS